MLGLLLGVFVLLSLVGLFTGGSARAAHALDDDNVVDEREGEEDYLSRQREQVFCDDVYSAHEMRRTDAED